MFQKIAARVQQIRTGRDLRQFILFLAVGVLNTAFGYGCFALLLYIGLHYSMAALLGTVIGVLFNFCTTGRIVFRNANNRLLLRFIGVYIAGYCFNLLGLRVLVAAGVGPYGGGALLLLPAALLSYFLMRRFVFAGEPS